MVDDLEVCILDGLCFNVDIAGLEVDLRSTAAAEEGIAQSTQDDQHQQRQDGQHHDHEGGEDHVGGCLVEWRCCRRVC